jgi:hypothetical protein
VGSFANRLHLGDIQINYYLDLVASLDFGITIDTFTYNNIDGFKNGKVAFDSGFEIGLEAGGSYKYKVKIWGQKEIKGEGEIEAKATARFKFKKEEQEKFITLSFEGLVAEVSFSCSKNEGDTKPPKPTPVTVFKGFDFKIDITDLF